MVTESVAMQLLVSPRWLLGADKLHAKVLYLGLVV